MSSIRLPLLTCVVLAFACLQAGLAHAQTSGLGRYDGPNITIDVGSMRVLSSNRAFDAWYPASTTKLMTAYVVFQAVRQGRVTMQSPVTISANAAAQPPSKAGLAVGQVLTVENALRVLMVKSANDIAVALAESVAGSEPAFIDQMNSAAQALGMSRSTFTNPHGLPDRGQVTTAYDLALLTLALMRDYPERNDFYSMGAVRLGEARWVNHNLLLQRYRGAFGFKTGYICDSGFNLVAGARRGGRTLITVTLGARSGLERAAASAHQLDEGFRRGGGLFGDAAGTPLAQFRPSGSVQTTATRLRPIVCQSPRVRPTFEEIAGQFGTSGPGFNPTAVASAFTSDNSAVVLPNSGAASGENDGADEIDVLDTLLGPVIREPQPIRLALGGATGPAVAPAGRWLVPNPISRPPSGQLALVPAAAPAAATSTALPGQIAPAASGPAVQLAAPASAPTTSTTTTSNPGSILGTVGRAVPIPVPSPQPRPN
ncbi:MAG: D-alanyl-D-alanine carboxypeptidase family protein [Hyphomicrobiales bacterium]